MTCGSKLFGKSSLRSPPDYGIQCPAEKNYYDCFKIPSPRGNSAIPKGLALDRGAKEVLQCPESTAMKMIVSEFFAVGTTDAHLFWAPVKGSGRNHCVDSWLLIFRGL